MKSNAHLTWKHFTENYYKTISLKEHNPCLKVLIAIGGWNEGSEKYSLLAETEESRNEFAEQAMRFMVYYGFDGLDIDWEYPTLVIMLHNNFYLSFTKRTKNP